MLAEKDHAGVYAEVSRAVAGSWILVDSHGDRGISAAQLAESMQIQAELAPDMTTALEQAVALTEAGDVILIFGSFNAIEQSLWLRSNDNV